MTVAGGILRAACRASPQAAARTRHGWLPVPGGRGQRCQRWRRWRSWPWRPTSPCSGTGRAIRRDSWRSRPSNRYATRCRL